MGGWKELEVGKIVVFKIYGQEKGIRMLKRS